MKLFALYSSLIFSAIGCQIAQANSVIDATPQLKQNSLNQDIRSFFETGRLRSQDRVLWQNPPSDVMPVQEQSTSWQFIIFREGGFSFWMPPGVLSEEKVSLETAVGELNFRTLASDTEDRRYLVGYASSLTDQQIKEPQILLNAIRDQVAPKDEFKLTEQRDINLDQYLGKELQFTDREETIIVRVYLVGNQVYALGIRYPNTAPKTRETRAFLNALQLLKP
jgi:hypothetical protein